MPDKIFVHIEYQEQTAKQKLEQMAQDLHNRFRDRGVEVAVTMTENKHRKRITKARMVDTKVNLKRKRTRKSTSGKS